MISQEQINKTGGAGVHQVSRRARYVGLVSAFLALGAASAGCGSHSTASACASGATRAARSHMTAEMVDAVQACSDVAAFTAEYNKAGPVSMGAAATLNAACGRNLPVDDAYPSFVGAPLCRSFETRCPSLAGFTGTVEDFNAAMSSCSEEIGENGAGSDSSTPPSSGLGGQGPVTLVPSDAEGPEDPSDATPTADDTARQRQEKGSIEEESTSPELVSRTVTRRVEGYQPRGIEPVERALSVTHFSIEGSDSAVRASFRVLNTSSRTVTLRPSVSATGPDSYASFLGSDRCYTFPAKTAKTVTVTGEGSAALPRLGQRRLLRTSTSVDCLHGTRARGRGAW